MTTFPRPQSPFTNKWPEGFSAPEVFSDVLALEDVRVRRAGAVVRTAGGVEITGSAAELSDDPTPRAVFELVERAATVESFAKRAAFREVPETYRYARSNGIALHTTHGEASALARAELAERDRVLRSWYGGASPERVLEGGGDALAALLHLRAYEVEVYVFPSSDGAPALSDLVVAGVFAFPKCVGAPLSMGFAARPGRAAAVESAARETLQQAAFLWEEPVMPESAPATIGPTALQHLEWWQHPSRHPALRAWLTGEHAAQFAGCVDDISAAVGVTPHAAVQFHDLTPAWAGAFRVARATCDAALPLVFGTPPWAETLPHALRVHPVG